MGVDLQRSDKRTFSDKSDPIDSTGKGNDVMKWVMMMISDDDDGNQ